MKTIPFFPTIAVIALLGAGCVVPRTIEHPRDVTSSPEKSDLHPLSELCGSPISTTIFERPRVLPVASAYKNLEILGPLFTASDCGQERLNEILGEPALSTLDMVIVAKAKDSDPVLKSALEKAGFLCYDDIVNDGCYTRQAGTKISDLLELKPLADKIHADYAEDAFTSYDEDVRFAYPADSKSSLCTDPPTHSEIGSVDYPVAAPYKNLDRFLGALFTQYQCSAERKTEALGTTGLYDSEVNLILNGNPSKELLTALERIGFVCSEENTLDNECTKWELRGAVPVERLIHLEPFTPDIARTDCLNCG